MIEPNSGHIKFNCGESVDDFNEQSIKILLSIFNTDEKDKIEKDFNQRSYLSEFDFYSDLDRKLRYIRDFVISLNQYEEGIKELLNIKNTNISDLVKDTYIGKEKLKKIMILENIK